MMLKVFLWQVIKGYSPQFRIRNGSLITYPCCVYETCHTPWYHPWYRAPGHPDEPLGRDFDPDEIPF